MKKYYKNIIVEMLQGDILYSTLGPSTYYVGHAVIIDSDYLVKESIPGKPSGHTMTIEQMWGRHHKGDRISLLRAASGADAAAKWATENLRYVKDYWILDINIQNLEKNYCSKLILQAYYYGANVKLTDKLNCFIPPQYFKYTHKLEKVALFCI